MSGTIPPWERYAQEQAPAQEMDGPWKRYAQPDASPGIGDIAGGIIRQGARGLALGFGDEIAAGVTAGAGALVGEPGTIGERYAAALENNRARDKAFETQYPKTSLAAQVGGALLNPLSRVGMGGSSTLPIRMAKNALAGGALGGVAGFGEGEGGFTNRLGAALTGAGSGAVIGGALPALATAASKVGRAAAPYLGLNVPKTDAQRVLLRDLERGGTSLDDVRTNLDAAGNQPMALADVGGENLIGRAQSVARVPGAGRQQAADFVAARGGLNQSARLTDEVKRAINAQDFNAAADDLIRTRAATAGPAYQRALAIETPVDVKPIIDDISARLSTAKGDIKATLQKAQGLFRDRAGKPDTTLAGLHETKLALDAMLEKTPTNSISRVARRELMAVQEKLLAAMDDASGGAYGTARAAFAGPSRAIDAMDLGKRILKGDADETAAEIAKLSPSERDFFRIGVSRALIDRVKNTGDTRDLSAIQNIWGSQGTRERVAAAFDDPAEFKRFSDFMANEMTMAKTNAMVNPRAGSQTAPLQQFAADGASPPPGTLFNSVLSAARGNPVGAIANMVRPYQRGQPDMSELAGEIAPYLFSLRPGDRARLIDELLRRQTKDAASRAVSNRIGDALLRGGTVGAVQLEN